MEKKSVPTCQHCQHCSREKGSVATPTRKKKAHPLERLRLVFIWKKRRSSFRLLGCRGLGFWLQPEGEKKDRGDPQARPGPMAATGRGGNENKPAGNHTKPEKTGGGSSRGEAPVIGPAGTRGGHHLPWLDGNRGRKNAGHRFQKKIRAVLAVKGCFCLPKTCSGLQDGSKKGKTLRREKERSSSSRKFIFLGKGKKEGRRLF